MNAEVKDASDSRSMKIFETREDIRCVSGRERCKCGAEIPAPARLTKGIWEACKTLI
jgi:hypothetical protein